MVPERELAWAAGLFEGEGTVLISAPVRHNMCSLVVQVANTDRDIIDFFHDRWAGYRAACKMDLTKHRPAWRWIVTARKAAGFLRQIRPYIVRSMMGARIDHGLAFQDAKQPGGRVPSGYLEEQWNAYMWMRELNLRGSAAANRDKAWGPKWWLR